MQFSGLCSMHTESYEKLQKKIAEILREVGYVSMQEQQNYFSEQQNSCLCVILLSCIYCQSICGSVFRILRNKEDLKILCNMGKTWQFANSAKPSRTLILDVLWFTVWWVWYWRTGMLWNMEDRKERREKEEQMIERRTKGTCWGFGFWRIRLFCLRIFLNKSNVYCY